MTDVSWEDLARHNTLEDLWIAIDGKAYDVSHWSKQHPGGALVLMHSAGKDASSQFQASHPAYVRRKLAKFYRGNMVPPSTCHPSKEAKVFAELQAAVESSGLMEPWIQPYLVSAAFLILLFSAAVYAAFQGWACSSALIVALFWQQTAFIGHDSGHNAVTQDRQMDSRLGLFVNAGVGIGMSWWKSTHNVHHMVVNAADSDPDIQFMPLLAVSNHFFDDLWSKYHQDSLVFDKAAQKLISWQHITFLPLLMVAKFGLYLQTIKHLIDGKAYINWRLEVLAQMVFFFWYSCFVWSMQGVFNALIFVIVSHAAFSVLHLQICLSHFACPTSDKMTSEAEDWMTQQIEHHLFPRMPRHNLRQASRFVRPACARLGLHYHRPTFAGAILETLQTLKAVAREAEHAQPQSQTSSTSSMKVISRSLI